MENSNENKKSSKWAWWFLAISFLFCIIVGVCTENRDTASSSSSQSSSSTISGKYLNLTVRDRGYKVEITNNESFDITNLRIRLNGMCILIPLYQVVLPLMCIILISKKKVLV